MMVVVDYLDELQWNWSTWLQWSVSWRDPASPDHTLAHSAESPRTTLVWWGGTEHTAPNPWICWMEPETLNNWYKMMVSLWYLWSPLWQLMNHDWSVASLRHHRGEVVSPGVPGHLPHWLEVVDHHESTWRDEFQILKSVGNSWSVYLEVPPRHCSTWLLCSLWWEPGDQCCLALSPAAHQSWHHNQTETSEKYFSLTWHWPACLPHQCWSDTV